MDYNLSKSNRDLINQFQTAQNTAKKDSLHFLQVVQQILQTFKQNITRMRNITMKCQSYNNYLVILQTAGIALLQGGATCPTRWKGWITAEVFKPIFVPKDALAVGKICDKKI